MSAEVEVKLNGHVDLSNSSTRSLSLFKQLDASVLKNPELKKTLSQPTHKAMLFILESIIRAPMTVNDLMEKLSKPAHQEIKKACHADKASNLEAFLKANKSVFKIDSEGIVRPTELLQVEVESSPLVDSTTNNKDSDFSSGSQKSSSERNNKNPVSSSDGSIDTAPKTRLPNRIYQPPCLKNRIEAVLSSNNGYPQRPRNPLVIDPTTIKDKSTQPPSEYSSDQSRDAEAIRYFERCMIRKGERWLPIKSLAGHLSQASEHIRNIVGQQIDFEKFLLKHPNNFEIQGSLVSLKEPVTIPISKNASFRKSGRQAPIRNRASVGNSSSNFSNSISGRNNKPNRPMSLIMLNPTNENASKSSRRYSNSSNPSTPQTPRKQIPGVVQVEGICLEMTAREYQAVMYLRKLLTKNPNGLTTIQLMTQLAEKAPELVLETIGQTEVELEGFLDIRSEFFEIFPGISTEHSFVMNKRFSKKINVVIVGGNSPDGISRTLTNKCGRVAHVAKQWGIIDLGKHEHVFFDKSIFRNVDDLQKHFLMEDILYFNAILAPKESRAKWRATQVWRECDKRHFGRMECQSGRLRSNIDLEDTDMSLSHFSTTSMYDETEFEGEMDEIDMSMPTFDEFSSLNDYNETLISGLARNTRLTEEELRKLSSDLADEMNRFYDETDAEEYKRKFSVNEFLTVTNEELWALGDEEEDLSISTSSNSFNEKQQLDIPLSTLKSRSTKVSSSGSVDQPVSSKPTLISVAVQTLSTGDIMTKQFYHEDDT